MKAIYINIDPYLQAFADWLNAGKPGTAPSFDPLPLAVTVPLGESAVIFAPISSDGEPQKVTVGETDCYVYMVSSPAGDLVEADAVPALSTVAPDLKYEVHSVSGSTYSMKVYLASDAEEADAITIPFTVLVRREQASGPVDLVDFTQPAAAIAAGTDLKGTKFNGNEIVAAAGTGALSAPSGS